MTPEDRVSMVLAANAVVAMVAVASKTISDFIRSSWNGSTIMSEPRIFDISTNRSPEELIQMAKVRIAAFSISLDGYGAGPDQSLQQPLGRGGEALHQWFFPTRTFRTKVLGKDDGTTGIDDEFAAQSFENVGAWILGRNMFGPVRGDWPDDSWKGWWGDNPPYHVPVFVLTHYPRDPIHMEGGTTFHFVTTGIEAALELARKASGDKDVRIGGGVSVIRQYLQARLVDEMHLAVSPVLLGAGENLFKGLSLPELGYEVTQRVAGEPATHVVITRK
jgi:dihydrofolate reductase